MTHFYNPISPYVISKNSPLKLVFECLSQTTGYPLTVINEDHSLFGVISAGDIARYLSSVNDLCANALVDVVCNQFPIVAHIDDSIESINKILLIPNIKSIPILDSSRKVIKVATDQNPFIKIGPYTIQNNSKPFLIAEIGVNHNGSIDEAIFLIESAAKAGCNAVKFQHRSKYLYNLALMDQYDLGTQYIISEIDRTKLSIDQLKQCCEFSKERNLEVVITPFDEIAFDEVVNNISSISAFKIASCDLSNRFLIDHILNSNMDKPLILSTGMSHERDIIKAASRLRDNKVNCAFLHCNSTYPAPPHDINLSYISRLMELTESVVGYSSHDGDPFIPAASVCFGAAIIEFHITRDKTLQGTDHRASIEVEQIEQLVNKCSILYDSIGNTLPRVPSQGELANLQSLGKSLALKEDRKKGYKLKKNDFKLVSPGSGYSIDQVQILCGKQLLEDMPANTVIKNFHIGGLDISDFDDLQNSIDYLTDNNYIPGIPVRFHDVDRLHSIFRTQMLEFHMSDRDLKLNPCEYLKNDYSKVDLIIHAIEQFEDGFIFDLASDLPKVVDRSFKEIERLITFVDTFKSRFNKSSAIPIVINPGGFSTDGFLDQEASTQKLIKIIDGLERLSLKHPQYMFLPQTMPPFPWHQGGRSFHNVLTNIQSLLQFTARTDLGICLDVSHTTLTCGYFGEDLFEHINILKDRIRHLHLSDAQGSNAEGLSIGAGSINFKELHNSLNLTSPTYMIPEIWQGHLDSGEKFANSLRQYSYLIK